MYFNEGSLEAQFPAEWAAVVAARTAERSATAARHAAEQALDTLRDDAAWARRRAGLLAAGYVALQLDDEEYLIKLDQLGRKVSTVTKARPHWSLDLSLKTGRRVGASKHAVVIIPPAVLMAALGLSEGGKGA